MNKAIYKNYIALTLAILTNSTAENVFESISHKMEVINTFRKVKI